MQVGNEEVNNIMAKPTEGLKPKHYKALELWEEGLLSLKEIATACKIPLDSMYDLFEGNSQKVGQTAHLFKAELDKITVRTASKIKTLVKDNKKLALMMMNERLKELRSDKNRGKAESLEINKILNTLSKSTPGVEIGSYHSISLTKGMTPEELVYEFRRLSAIARNPSVGGGVRKIDERAEGRIPRTSADGDAVSEE